MPARHFSSVLLPLPLRPAIPKNSPRRTSKEMSLSALKVSWRVRRSGCSARSLSVCVRSSGTLKVLLIASATIGGVALLGGWGIRGKGIAGAAGTSRLAGHVLQSAR